MAFKKPNRKRNLRQRDEDNEEEDEDIPTTRMSDIREIQKSRERPAGLSAAELALGMEAPEEGDADPEDPLKVGGLIDLKSLKKGKLKKATIEDSINANFSKESSLRDEDEEMRKFVEAEMTRRKGPGEREFTSGSDGPKNTIKDWENALYELPEHLKKYQSKKNEEMLSNQMLVGIPEVDLGMEAKIRNIEETEAQKLRLLREAQEKKRTLEEATSYNQDLVKDLACDYVQHHQFNISRTTDLGQAGRRSQKKELEEVMADADNLKVVGEKAVPWVLAGQHEDHEDDREDPVCDGNFYAD